jgi:hypothetical protein
VSNGAPASPHKTRRNGDFISRARVSKVYTQVIQGAGTRRRVSVVFCLAAAGSMRCAGQSAYGIQPRRPTRASGLPKEKSDS